MENFNWKKNQYKDEHKIHNVKAYCVHCKKWDYVIQRKSYSGFVCQCMCGMIFAIRTTTKMPGHNCYEKHFNSIEELGKHFNLEYFE